MLLNQNPLEIFGLTPEFVAQLSEKELFLIVHSIYRSILKTVHPDVAIKNPKKKTRNIQKAIKLNLAFESLNLEKNPVAFRKHRKEYISRSSKIVYKKNLQLQEELLFKKNKNYEVLNSYFNYFVQSYARPFKNVKLGLLDVALNQNLQMAKWSLGSNYKQILINEEEQIYLKRVGRREFSKVNYIFLLGTLKMEKSILLSLLEKERPKFFRSLISTSPVGCGVGNSVENKISQENFKVHVLPNLKAEIQEQAYLFSLNKSEFEESGFITLEGFIVKAEKYFNS